MPEKQVANIDQYIASFPKNIQITLQELRRAIKEAAPQAEETISYQMPAFKLNGILVWFAAFKDHVSFFPKTSAIEAFKEELADYKLSKGTVRFSLDKPIPLDLVKKMVRFRAEENMGKL